MLLAIVLLTAACANSNYDNCFGRLGSTAVLAMNEALMMMIASRHMRIVIYEEATPC